MPKDSRSIWGGRLEAMNGELWAPGKPSFTQPYCGKRGTAAMDPIIARYPWNSDEETEHSTKTKKPKEQQLFLKTRNGNIRSNGKHITPRAEEGYCNEATQSGPLIHSQNQQAQNAAEQTEVKKRRAWTREEIREVVWCYMYSKQHFTENYKKMYEIWRQRNPESRIYMDAKKLMN